MGTRVQFDTSAMKPLIVGTKRTLASGTARAVRIGLREGADFARTNHKHVKRSGFLTLPENLFGEVESSDDSGTFGHLDNLAHYAANVEDGTSAHVILPRDFSTAPPRSRVTGRRSPADPGAGRGTALRFQVGGKTVFARKVKHPGTKSMPFMMPAAKHAEAVIERETENFTFGLLAEIWE